MKKSWELFLIAIGLLMIATSPRTPQPMIFIIMGLVIILVGIVLIKKK